MMCGDHGASPDQVHQKAPDPGCISLSSILSELIKEEINLFQAKGSNIFLSTLTERQLIRDIRQVKMLSQHRGKKTFWHKNYKDACQNQGCLTGEIVNKKLHPNMCPSVNKQRDIKPKRKRAGIIKDFIQHTDVLAQSLLGFVHKAQATGGPGHQSGSHRFPSDAMFSTPPFMFSFKILMPYLSNIRIHKEA